LIEVFAENCLPRIENCPYPAPYEPDVYRKGVVIASELSTSDISAIDGRVYKAQGPKWRKSDRQQDIAPVGLRNAV
jgi:hypothetical protein